MPKQPTLYSIALCFYLVGCSHPKSDERLTEKEILETCWDAKELDDQSYVLSTSVVNLGKHGWKAGTNLCGGVALQITPEPNALGEMYKIESKQPSSDALGPLVYDIRVIVIPDKQTGNNLKVNALEVISLERNIEAQSCETLELFSKQEICETTDTK